MTRFQPGQSGNPKGRPKKDRALTDLLEKAGSATIEFNGAHISGKRLAAKMVWEGVTTGSVTFPDGNKMRLAPQDWKDFVKWIYSHIDGPPTASVDITTAGEAIKGYMLVSPDDWDLPEGTKDDRSNGDVPPAPVADSPVEEQKPDSAPDGIGGGREVPAGC